MNLPLKQCLTLICIVLYLFSDAQEAPWVTTFEEREELNQILNLSNGNYILSGKTFEIGNKSDLVILVDENGSEIKRRTICIPCSLGDIVYSKETPNKEVMHVRSSGDIFVSNLDLEETRFVYNIKGSEFDNVETYQVLENSHFIVIVSYAIKDGVRGLLHTTINTWSEQLLSHKFNSSFPDISGSIGIDLFNDVGVVDGYNSLNSETNVNSGHLLRYDISRNLIWSTDLTWGNILLQHVLVSFDQKIYAVGSIQDEDDENHWQGLVVHFDNDGTFLWEKRIDSPYKEDGVNPQTTITTIKQFQPNKFVLLGNHSKENSGIFTADAFVITIDKEAEVLDNYTNAEITLNSEAVDVVSNKQNELVYLAKSYGVNGIAGSFLSIARNITSSAYGPLAASGIEIFPNPATDRLIINDTPDGGTLHFEIFNLFGSKVMDQTGGHSVDLTGLNAGTYYLAIYTGKEKYIHTFIKE